MRGRATGAAVALLVGCAATSRVARADGWVPLTASQGVRFSYVTRMNDGDAFVAFSITNSNAHRVNVSWRTRLTSPGGAVWDGGDDSFNGSGHEVRAGDTIGGWTQLSMFPEFGKNVRIATVRVYDIRVVNLDAAAAAEAERERAEEQRAEEARRDREAAAERRRREMAAADERRMALERELAQAEQRHMASQSALGDAAAHDREAAERLASGHAGAINSTLQAELDRLRAQALATGSAEAAAGIAMHQAELAQAEAVGALAATAIGFLFDLGQQREAEERARRQREEEERERREEAEARAAERARQAAEREAIAARIRAIEAEQARARAAQALADEMSVEPAVAPELAVAAGDTGRLALAGDPDGPALSPAAPPSRGGALAIAAPRAQGRPVAPDEASAPRPGEDAAPAPLLIALAERAPALAASHGASRVARTSVAEVTPEAPPPPAIAPPSRAAPLPLATASRAAPAPLPLVVARAACPVRASALPVAPSQADACTLCMHPYRVARARCIEDSAARNAASSAACRDADYVATARDRRDCEARFPVTADACPVCAFTRGASRPTAPRRR